MGISPVTGQHHPFCRTLAAAGLALLAGVFTAGAQELDIERLDVDSLVDGAIKRAAFGEPSTKPLEALGRIGAPAVPRLVHYLETGHPNERRAAAFALSFCWSDAAREPARKYLGDRDTNVRDLLVAAVKRHETDPQVVVDIASPWLDDRNPSVAGSAFDLVEAVAPDPQRMKTVLADKRKWRYALAYLPRYEDPSLTPATLGLLRGGRLDEKVAAVISLIHQSAGTPTARRAVAAALRAPNPLLRDRCGAYFTWFGRPDDLDAIEQSLKTTRDTHARASLIAAIAMIKRRTDAGLNEPVPDLTDAAIQPAGAEDYAAALVGLQDGDYASAFRTYALGQAFEPVCQLRGADAPRDQVETHVARTMLLRALFGVPGKPRRSGVLDALPDGDPPPASDFVTPVRVYYNAGRESFGRLVPPGESAFAGRVHVGDDVAWHAPHDTVVAIAAGRVVGLYEGGSWGGMVVIEHIQGGERFCSLYGHLGPFITVEHGQKVEAGQKIGSVGRADTLENGGFGAHLHFAVHRGGFGMGRWTAGYVSPAAFADEQAGWLDPQAFLKEKRAK